MSLASTLITGAFSDQTPMTILTELTKTPNPPSSVNNVNIVNGGNPQKTRASAEPGIIPLTGPTGGEELYSWPLDRQREWSRWLDHYTGRGYEFWQCERLAFERTKQSLLHEGVRA